MSLCHLNGIIGKIFKNITPNRKKSRKVLNVLQLQVFSFFPFGHTTGHFGTWLPADTSSEASFTRKGTFDPQSSMKEETSQQCPNLQVPPLSATLTWAEINQQSFLWNTHCTDVRGMMHNLNTSRHWTAAMFPRMLKCFGNHLESFYERFAFFGDNKKKKHINFSFWRFPFSSNSGVPPWNYFFNPVLICL